MNSFLSDQIRQAILISAIALFCYSGTASAQSAEELKLEVETLKKRVQELESTPCVDPNVSNPPTKKIKSDGNPWHSLQVGMSKTDVTSLLGKPGRIDKWGKGEAWYYPNSRGGEVDLDANGTVSGWLEP
jgi:hypothetical protein